ncbi:TerC family protein [Peribacillus alkalitolerans]|uniref:TerC family protein n=1 Tax=Peribacillus alkalitolerans TaxID=1550385 RepID=UPI0013D7908A|nr:TerC family protein [Peribacillus alkalitolerans]
MDQALVLNLLEIILINIVLSGDNAVVIALACRNLPKHYKDNAVLFGTLGAIVLRVLLTFVAVYLLTIPFLNFIGGLLLLWIAVKLIKGDEEEDIRGNTTLMGAIKTIVIADIIMSIDNVVAVAGVAQGDIILIIIGLLISIPLIIWGSSFLMFIMEKFPIIIIIGAALLGFTAGDMMLKDLAVGQLIENLHPTLHHIIPFALATMVIIVGKLGKSSK